MLKIDPDEDEDSDLEAAKKVYVNDTNAIIPNTRSLRGNQVSLLPLFSSMLYYLCASSALIN